MSVFRVEKNNNYTVMSNYHLRDKNLSYKAKGLLSFMLSLPENWDYSMNGLVAISKEGIKAIRNILKELQEHGYLSITKKQNRFGQFEYEYSIFECPDSQKGDMDLGDVEKDTQINTNYKDDDDKNKITSFFVAEEHNILTLELIDKGYINEEDTNIFYYDELFEKLLLKGNSYKNMVKVIHYIVSKVVENNFQDENGNIIGNKYGYFKSSIINNLKILKARESEEELWTEEYIKDLLDSFQDMELDK